MTGTELLRCHKMAKEFAELYSVTGMVGIHTDSGVPCIQLRTATFFEMFGDGVYGYEHHKNGDKTITTMQDGVKYLTYVMESDKIPERRKDE